MLTSPGQGIKNRFKKHLLLTRVSVFQVESDRVLAQFVTVISSQENTMTGDS